MIALIGGRQAVRQQGHQRERVGILHGREIEQVLDADGRRLLENRSDLALQQLSNPVGIVGPIDAEQPNGLAAARERFGNAAHDQQHVRLDAVQVRPIRERRGALESMLENGERAGVVGREAAGFGQTAVRVVVEGVTIAPAVLAR